jgi:lipopolysaccharide transport system permease protein
MRLRASAEWIENTPSGIGPAAVVADLWSHRELAGFFAWRELKLRYKQTLLGVAWVVLQPLLAMALFTILLERTVGLPSDGVEYAVFAYVGLAVWTALSTAVSRTAESLVDDPDLITKVYFPRILAPLGAGITAAVDAAIALAFAAPLMLAYGVAPAWTVVFVPVCLVATVAVTLGVGIWLAALHVLYRDVRYAMTFALQVWFFASPVIYPASAVDGDLRLLYFVNPVAGLLDATRASVLGTPLDGAGLAVSAASLVLIAATGAIYFSSAERQFADRV